MRKKNETKEDLLKELLGEDEQDLLEESINPEVELEEKEDNLDLEEELLKNEDNNTKKSMEQKENNAAWYRIGKDAEEYARQKAILAQQRKERAVPNFFLKVDEDATIVFVDDKGFGVNIHKVKVGDRWITLTCVKDFAPCPICATGNRSSYVIYYTVIDTRPYTDREGKTTKFRKVLFPATGVTLQSRIADEKAEQNGLVGAVCYFKRYSAKEASAGTLVKCKGKIDIAKKFGAEFTKPLDYLKILAPPTTEELESLGISVNIIGDEDILGDIDI
jgi:hypothetical protein